MELQEIDKILRKKLDSKRYDHTVGVMYTAAAMCMHYDIDINKGLYAGLLHDCAKAYKAKKQYDLCKKHHIHLSKSEEDNVALVHAKLGSYLSENLYKIKDEEILSAVLYHTTGRPEMTTLEKIIYIADYIEPHRKLPRVEALRKLAFQDLDKCMYLLTEMSIQHLETSNREVEKITIKTYHYYKKIQENKEVNTCQH